MLDFQLNTLKKSVSPADASPIIKATCTKVHKVSDKELPPAPTMIRRRSETGRLRTFQASPTSLTLRRPVRPRSSPLCSAGRFYLIFESSRKLIVVVFKILIFLARNLKNADLMGGKADAVIHVSLGDKELKTKVKFNIFYQPSQSRPTGGRA